MLINVSVSIFLTIGVLVFHMIWIGWMDLRRMKIPEFANVSLAASGLIWQLASDRSMSLQLAQVVARGFLLWLVRCFYMQLRKRQGLGLGDVKFVAAASAWVGVVRLPWLILAASMSALAIVIGKQLLGHQLAKDTRLAFGPHLCIGLLATWLAMSYDLL